MLMATVVRITKEMFNISKNIVVSWNTISCCDPDRYRTTYDYSFLSVVIIHEGIYVVNYNWFIVNVVCVVQAILYQV